MVSEASCPQTTDSAVRFTVPHEPTKERTTDDDHDPCRRAAGHSARR